ncbi:ABC transporter permease [Saccharibacillus sp. CPCC 101409]|uniref:ABC transporter permease n=1 Tax=Saccharibacillus sp. CPCC 101409 TaxID=3058041 RepID=UPI002671BBD4|nr:ABC transporter permease [Saccharibacillus sp. CPCC 101409]MDO3410014.1 ABC transporter permease [Saccharibacillus sp. CPCC 101409]
MQSDPEQSERERLNGRDPKREPADEPGYARRPEPEEAESNDGVRKPASPLGSPAPGGTELAGSVRAAGRWAAPLRLVAVFAVLNLLWALLAAALHRDILPSPAVVYRALLDLDGREALLNIGFSMGRVFAGILLALVAGLLLGLLMGRSPRWNRLLDPVVYLTYPVPKIALLPVAMLFLGLGETSKIVMIALILVFQVIISVRDGVRAIPANTYDVLSSLGAGRMAKFAYITLPGALSSILSTVRISLGTAFSILFFTEIYGTEHGMGYFIMDAWLRLNYPQMYAGILLFSLVGFVLFVLVDLFEHRFMRWRD